ncbi:hypothetical protein BC628DRAFT_1410726 [Trametes gibbosa]|nr:hypothetical protein BC628DRAFT_1410726 [Trametes gibbosa]
MNCKDFDAHTERRWSELVPPHTALTFAAIWDPDEGMVTFSGAHLLDSCTDKGNGGTRGDSPYDITELDGQSQVLTLDRFAMTMPSAGFDPLAYARDALVDAETVMDSRSCLGLGGNAGGLRVPPGIHTAPDSPAAASSMALASLINAPFRKSLVKDLVDRGKQHIRPRRPDIQMEEEEDGPYDIDPYELKYMQQHPSPCRRPDMACRRPDSAGRDSDRTVTDEGFFEAHRLTRGTFVPAPVLVDVNLSSAFSVTTTSTSRYVEIDPPRADDRDQSPHLLRERNGDGADSQHESTWTTLRDVERDICFNVPLEVGRRLRKPRTPQSSQPTSHHMSASSSSALLSPRSPRSPRSPPSPSTPAPPAEVLARRHYNHLPHPSHPPSSSRVVSDSSGATTNGHRNSLRRTKELLHRVVSCKKGNEDDHWVCVEVQHKVKQRVCVVDL